MMEDAMGLEKAIDISTAQGRIDWLAVRAEVRAVWCKASEGAYKSAKRSSYIKRELDAAYLDGMDRGAYHLARVAPGPVAELDTYREVVAKLARPRLELVHVLDFEHTRQPNGLYRADGHGTEHTIDELVTFAARWADELPASVLYGSRSLLDDLADWPLPLFVSSRPWSPARAPRKIEELLAKQPKIEWAAWQYESEQGRIAGIQGPCDRVIMRSELCRIEELAQ